MNGLDFHGQTVWITGAGKGIGYATALAFVEAGAQVTGFDLAFDGESYPFATETLNVAALKTGSRPLPSTLAGRLTCSSRRWRSSAARKAGRL